MSRFPKTRPTLQQARLKAEKYCAYQERSQLEVKRKLLNMGLTGTEADEVMVHLIQNNFLNEERFARAFTKGKQRAKQWGITRIRQELRAKGINDKLSSLAIAELDQEEYRQTLMKLIEKKQRTLKETDPWKRMAKLRNYLVGKGYEPELVSEALRTAGHDTES